MEKVYNRSETFSFRRVKIKNRRSFLISFEQVKGSPGAGCLFFLCHCRVCDFFCTPSGVPGRVHSWKASRRRAVLLSFSQCTPGLDNTRPRQASRVADSRSKTQKFSVKNSKIFRQRLKIFLSVKNSKFFYLSKTQNFF